MPMIKNIKGNRYSRLIVLERYGAKYGQAAWLCQCDCGNKTVVISQSLRTGHTRSCGCLIGTNNEEHGHWRGGHRTREYYSWSMMKSRCNNPNDPAYKYYGGRGIKVCERWTDFKLFLEDMKERPPGKNLERIDNDGNYEPNNCRWATQAEQMHNKRPSIRRR